MINRKSYIFGIVNFSSLLLILCTLVNYVLVLYAYPIISENDLVVNNDEEFTVIIDAGHGGADPGAVSENGVLEKDLNLSVANYISEYLANMNTRVLMTRENDIQLSINGSHLSAKTQDLKARSDFANSHQNGILVSIHMNNFSDSDVHGLQVWYSSNGRLSELLAESIQKNVVNTIQLTNKRTIKKDQNSIYILKKSTIPAVLVECGFMSNENELLLLKNKSYQQELAKSIANGILLYLGEKNSV